MVRGLTSAATGMMAQMAAQDAIANNLANANTTGYKRDIPTFQAVLSGAAGAAPMTHVSSRNGSDFTQGSLVETGDQLQMALDGQGFFTVQTAGGIAYTRDGSFKIGTDGYLVTQSGDRVMGGSGPIRVVTGGISVDSQGTITRNGNALGKLKIVSFPRSGSLTRIGGNLWTAGSATPTIPAGTTVRQGYLESSNVNSVSEMVSMISAFRTFEASQKVIQAADSTLDKSVNEVGRVA